MLCIQLNGEQKKLDLPLTVAELLRQFSIRMEAIAVAVNEEIIPRSALEKINIKEGDRVEVVRAVGGG